MGADRAIECKLQVESPNQCNLVRSLVRGTTS